MTEILAGALRGDQAAVRALAQCDPAAVRDEAVRHGVAPLLHDALLTLAGGPAALLELLSPLVQQIVFSDLLSQAELTRALEALDRAGTAPVIIKGTHLAYVHYPQPTLRPRLDTDIMVAESTREAADHALSSLGYVRQGGMTGEFVSHQSLYVKRIDSRPTSVLDVHWKIANTQVFADVLTHEDLARGSVPIPPLGPHARGPSNVHALLLACMHRMAHHQDSDRLIWLYDIYLLGSGLSDAEWRAFADLAADRQIVAICRRSLERTDERFPTSLPSWLATYPRWIAAERELSANYLVPRRPVRAIADELRALPRWRDRWRLVREHLFPPATYMRTVYAPRSGAPIAYLHARRLLRGARKWLRVGG